MSKTLASILLPIWMIFCSYWYVCQIKNHCGNNGQTKTEVSSTDGLHITDGNFSTNFGNEDIYFLHNTDSLVVEGNGAKALEDLASHLKSSDRSLTITGEFLNDESGTSSGEELGLARAATLSTYLQNLGVPANKIHTSFAANNALKKVGDKVIYPIGLTFSDHLDNATYDEEKMNAAMEYLKANPQKNVYFSTGSSIMDITPDIHQYLDYASYYLAHHQDKTIDITGYTDDVGNSDSNLRLGQQRAAEVASYLQKNEVSADQISSSSKGEADPIADNSTAEGRQKNRRVQLSISL